MSFSFYFLLYSRPKSKNSISPYSQNYRAPIPHCQKHLIAMHLTVTKLSRSDLEDKYIQLCDENYQLKHESKDLKEKIKLLSTKIMRVSSASLTIRRFKSVDMLSQDSSGRENNHDECENPENPNQKKQIRPKTGSLRPLKAKNQLDTDQFMDGVLNVLQGTTGNTEFGRRGKMEKQSYVDRINELQQELDSKKEECEDLKNKNFDLIAKNDELDSKIFEETKKLVTANMEMKSLKRKAEKYELQAKHLKEEKREIEKKYESTLSAEKKKFGE